MIVVGLEKKKVLEGFRMFAEVLIKKLYSKLNCGVLEREKLV